MGECERHPCPRRPCHLSGVLNDPFLAAYQAVMSRRSSAGAKEEALCEGWTPFSPKKGEKTRRIPGREDYNTGGGRWKMHLFITAMSWSHHLHDSWLFAWHEVDQHLHSRHFWTGVGVTLLVLGFIALMVTLAMHAPAGPMSISPYNYPIGPYQ